MASIAAASRFLATAQLACSSSSSHSQNGRVARFQGLRSVTVFRAVGCQQSRAERSICVGAPSRHGVTMAAAVLDVVDFEGKAVGVENLELRTARPETARAVVHRGLITEMQNKRAGTASTKTRAEVRGGGRKPMKQKGSGRARIGSTRTPLRPGGGVVFGPKPKDWTIKINKKEKSLAISTALQSAAGSTVVVDNMEQSFTEPKTKLAKEALKRWGVNPDVDHTLVMVSEAPEPLHKSFRNLPNVELMTPLSINVYDILRADKLVVSKSMVAFLNERYPPRSEVAADGE